MYANRYHSETFLKRIVKDSLLENPVLGSNGDLQTGD